MSAAIAIRWGSFKRVGISPLLDHFAVTQREMADRVGIAIAHQQLIADDERAERISEACPFRDELAIGSENLDAVIAAIGDKHPPVAIDGDAMRGGELARSVPILASLATPFAG